MSKFFKSKNELILGLTGIVLLGILIWVFIWGISFLAVSVGKSINLGNNEKNPGANFDLEGAKQLDLKGLVQ
ncbi:MAG: hypothetical protein HY432_00655 [Candidatus Liptonbacteria bacterium]|nr:hypothetical protein [Candidatus Liptonbacteria bacterium]